MRDSHLWLLTIEARTCELRDFVLVFPHTDRGSPSEEGRSLHHTTDADRHGNWDIRDESAGINSALN